MEKNENIKKIMGEYEKTGNIYMEIYNILKQYHDSFKK